MNFTIKKQPNGWYGVYSDNDTLFTGAKNKDVCIKNFEKKYSFKIINK